MTTVYDIPPEVFIADAAGELKKLDAIKAPDWAEFAKTGVHKQMPPKEADWWYTRAASVMRRVYIDGPVGVQRLRSVYGGKMNRGSKPNRFMRGSGSITRKLLQQLETAGYIQNTPEGRIVSGAGRKFMDGVAAESMKKIAEKYPGLDKY